jgi:hypothetical protein
LEKVTTYRTNTHPPVDDKSDRTAFARVSLFQSMEAALDFAWPKYGPWVLDGDASYRMFTGYMDSRP